MRIERVAAVAGERERWAAVDASGTTLAAASLWVPEQRVYRGKTAGVVGRYEAADRDAARALLDQVATRLADAGCEIAIGPMDGDTWHSYRFVTESGDEPPFFLEPRNPQAYVTDFAAAGYTPIEHYRSDLSTNVQDAAADDPRAAAARDAIGGTIRNLELARFDDEIRRIYRLSVDAFAHNVLYAPIGEDAFLAMYAKMRAFVDPALCLMYEHADELIGFVFAIPDLENAERNGSEKTCVIKTMARRPGEAWTGAGTVLSAAIRSRMRELGYRRAIHALMHDANRSARMSERTAVTIRRYALFGRAL